MAGKRPILGIVAIIFLAAAITFDMFVILSGAVAGGFENKIYFLQASTDGVTNSIAHPNKYIPNPARWTYFAVCGEKNGNNIRCNVAADPPFDPKRNFQTSIGLPPQFQHSDGYYYLSRISWAFYLIALFFAVVALLLCVAALFARLGAYLTGLSTALALLFQTVAAACMTSWTVLAKDHFKQNGQSAKLGVYAYAFTWTCWFCLLLSTVLFCVGGSVSKDSAPKSGKSGYFGRKRSTRSRGSFYDSESGRRVKDEYD